jgi:hypothetical protein
MKTNEEKLKRLLEVAVENRWKALSWDCYAVYYDEDLDKVIIDETLFYSVSSKSLLLHCKGNKFSSINDLVTNFEEGELSFIEALCKLPFQVVSEEYKSKGAKDIYVPKDRFINEWHSTPTSERLNVLFNSFNHLL